MAVIVGRRDVPLHSGAAAVKLGEELGDDPSIVQQTCNGVPPNVLALAALPSLGIICAQMRIDVGIKTSRRCAPWGRKPAFARCAFTSDGGCRSNFIYALECAIRGIAWKMLKPVRKAALLEAARRIILELES